MELRLGPIQIVIGQAPKAKATFEQVQAANNLYGAGVLGRGNEWAPEIYGHYYAQSVPVYRAVKLRADAVAGARLLVYRRIAGARAEVVEETHPVQELLDKVNPWWTAAGMWKATETYLSLWGSAYWWLQREAGKVVAIWPLRPDRMRIIAGGNTPGDNSQYISGFLYFAPSPVRFNNDEIVWFRYFNPLDEYGGMAPIAAGRQSFDMGKDALRFNREFFRNGAVPQDLIFTVQGPITEEQVADFYARLEKRHSGANNANRPMVWDLSQGGAPSRLGLSQRDMEFLETLHYTVEDAARIWGIPPPKLFSQKASIYNNVRQAHTEFYTDTVNTEWQFLAGEVNEMLLPLVAPGEDLFVEFDTSKVLPLQEELAVAKTADLGEVAAGTMTINEYRDKYSREPVPWGDVYWKPFGLVATADETASGGNPSLPPGSGVPGEAVGASLTGLIPEKTVTKAVTAFENRLCFADAQFLALQKRLFEEQQRDIMVRLREHKSVKQVDDSVFNQQEWTVRYKRRGMPLLTEVLTLSAQAQAVEFALGAFDPTLSSVVEWLVKRTDFWADRVNLETAQLLMAELAEARAQGESIAQIQQRVEKVFRFSDMVRSERIARTETLAASNQGHLAVYAQSGVVEEKMWLATLDERTRADHAEAHRQVVPLGGQFHVNGEMLDGPGLGNEPANNVNCRCTVIPVLKRRSYVSEAMLYETQRSNAVRNGGKPAQ